MERSQLIDRGVAVVEEPDPDDPGFHAALAVLPEVHHLLK